MYNFQVRDLHTYFVGDSAETAVLVHNDDRASAPDNSNAAHLDGWAGIVRSLPYTGSLDLPGIPNPDRLGQEFAKSMVSGALLTAAEEETIRARVLGKDYNGAAKSAFGFFGSALRDSSVFSLQANSERMIRTAVAKLDGASDEEAAAFVAPLLVTRRRCSSLSICLAREGVLMRAAETDRSSWSSAQWRPCRRANWFMDVLPPSWQEQRELVHSTLRAFGVVPQAAGFCSEMDRQLGSSMGVYLQARANTSRARIAAFRAQQTAGSIDTIPPGQRLIRPPYYDAGRVPGPNPNNLGQRVVTWPTRGQGGAYYKPQGGKTKAGSATDFYKRYGPNDPEGIQVEVPQTRHGPPPGVDNADYWTPERQRRFDEEYLDRLLPPDVRYRSPRKRQRPVDQEKWDKYRHVFGYGDLPSDFGHK